MKRASSHNRSAGRSVGRVQRAGIRRAQAGGKRRAHHQARKTAPAIEAPKASPRSPIEQAAQAALFTPHTRRWFAALVLLVAFVGVLVVVVQNVPEWWASAAAARATADATLLERTRVAAEVAEAAQRIGIVSGHRGNDSGAVCDDGLTEAEVNFRHATRVADMLRAEGYVVDVLDEFDPRLKGYRARVLLSIHADSCARINALATGFKVARAMHSRLPEQEDRLVACLTEHYRQRTGLRFHANTVTHDMTAYHAFDEIDPSTPAAIIETGFLYLDRDLLTRKPELVTQGIVDGLLCFLRDDGV